MFTQRIRDEWEDALIKRFVHKEQGDVGTILSPEELKQANLAFNTHDSYVYRYESMKLQFIANQRLNKELEEFKTMEEYMDTLF